MMNMVFDFQKLKGRMVEKKQNQQKLANKIGMCKVTLNRKLNNKVPFNQKEIVKLIDELEIPKEEIFEYFFNAKV